MIDPGFKVGKVLKVDELTDEDKRNRLAPPVHVTIWDPHLLEVLHRHEEWLEENYPEENKAR